MILLIDPVKNFLERERKLKKPYPHAGMAYIATYLKNNGFECKIIDRNAADLSLDEIVIQIKKFQPVLIGMTAMTFNVNDAYEVAKSAKAISPNIKIVLGGVHPTLMPEETLHECEYIDVVVAGEGESAMKELSFLAENGGFDENLRQVKSIWYRDREKNRILNNSAGEMPLIYDYLPFPEWSLYDYQMYCKIYSEKFKDNIHIYQINTSRGCAFNCTFCSPIHSNKVRYRTAENIVTEMKRNYELFQARHFDFADSNATFRRDNFLEICRLLISEKLNNQMSFSIDTSINLLDREILEAAAKAGCEVVSLGIESGSDFILGKMNKKYSAAEAFNMIKIATELDLKVKTSFVLGHPYETLDTAYETYRFAKKLREKFGVEYYYNLVDVYPKTELYQMVERNEGGARWIEGMKGNWNSYKRTTPMIELNDLNREKLQNLYHEFNQELLGIAGSNFYEAERGSFSGSK